MKWISALSTANQLPEAEREITETLRHDLGSAIPQVLFLFVRGYENDALSSLPERLRHLFPNTLVFGCKAAGLFGGGQEIEHGCALSVLAGHLPGARVHGFHFDPSLAEDPDIDSLSWPNFQNPNFILIADPFSFNPTRLLEILDQRFPESAKIGGLASGGKEAGQHLLFLEDRCHSSGLIGLAWEGDWQLSPLVAQGCRPIGLPYFATRCRDNLLFELDGVPVVEAMELLFNQLAERDQDLFHHALFLGIGISLGKESYQKGDFLIRNILGFVETEQGFAIGGPLLKNQVVQFHLRDPRASREDLSFVLHQHRSQSENLPAPAAILAFSCIGRGEGFYREPSQDSGMLQRYFGDVPTAGFFASGEIGSLRGKTYLHSFSNVLGVIRGKEPS